MSAVPRLAVGLRWRPEWPCVVAAGAAWAALAAGAGQGSVAAGHGGHYHLHGSMPAQLPGWTLMTMAMMLPAALPAVRHVMLNSIRVRRIRAMVVFTSAYVAVWVAFGAVATAGYMLARTMLLLTDGVFLTLALYTAMAWQFTRTKRRAVLACRRTVPLPPCGRRADAACARFGLLQASRCVRSCWALMVVMVVAGHHSHLWMLSLAPLVWLEELTPKGRRQLSRIGAALGVMTAVAAVGAYGA